MTEIQDDSWKDEEFRRKTTEEIESVIKATGLKVTAEKLEAAIFTKSDSKEKYLDNVAKVNAQLKQRALFLANQAKNQSDESSKDSVQEEKKDEMEKESNISKDVPLDSNNQSQTSTSIDTTNDMMKTGEENKKDMNPSEMEGALKRLSLAETVKVKSEKTETPIVSTKTPEQINAAIIELPTPVISTKSPEQINTLGFEPSVSIITTKTPEQINSIEVERPIIPANTPEQPLPVVQVAPMIAPVRISELKISQVHQNVKHPDITSQLTQNKPSADIRIAQVHGSFHPNIPRNILLPHRRTSDPPPLHSSIRSSVPRISSVTSLHRPQMWENQQPMQGQMSMPARLPLPNPSRSNLFDESKRHKYRDGLIRRMLMAEESVYNKARTEEQYVTFFQNLFVETSNQINLSTDPNFKIASCKKCRVNDTPQNLYHLLTNEPDHLKMAIADEFKLIDFQITSILRKLTADPVDISIKNVKLPPDEFERSLSAFCSKMSPNYSITERSDIIKID